MREAAGTGDAKRVARFLKDMEIPNCDAWLHKMYESGSADSWRGVCDASSLDSKEKSMQERFVQMAKQGGDFSTRKVNDDPEPGRGLEWGWLQAIRQPLDIYFASWKAPGAPKGSRGDPVGYFMFIEGGFRWDSGIEFSVPIIQNAKFVPAKLMKRVDPVYPPEAASHNITGTVRVSFTVGADGVVYNAHAVSGEGLTDDPSLRKAAEDAVMQWRYQPATINGKPAQGEGVTVDIKFSAKT
ncbi:MAG TPA: energy transducer TonB [Candidatus Acidoferrales bacterium]|nr:energy transducer TonB [Candidatus Acidoferrales bacterium]